MTLDQLQLGKRARVIRVHGGRGLRRNLTQMGVHPGDIVHLTQGGAFYGPVVIEVNGSKIALGEVWHVRSLSILYSPRLSPHS